MTEHHISHSEAFNPGPAVQIRYSRRRRFFTWTTKRVLAAAAIWAVVIALVDSAIGAPLFLMMTVIIGAIALVSPGRRP